MTEQEAIKFLTGYLDSVVYKEKCVEAHKLAIKALEENQQYRAIGTPEECRSAAETIKSMIERNLTTEIMTEYMKFEDECVKQGFSFNSLLEAREKQTAKKPKLTIIKHGKHKWERDEKGYIDEFAFCHDNHNGVVCEVCGKTVCVHCDPNYDELIDCEEKYWNCPCCGKKIYSKSKFCDCGQKLYWSD